MNFAECPENLHFELAFGRAMRKKKADMDIVHDFRFPYSFIKSGPPPGDGRRVRCLSLEGLKTDLRGSYDLLVVLDFAKRRSCAAPFLWLLKGSSCRKRIFIANHLIPMPGHNPTADLVRKLGLMRGFDRVYMLGSDDRTLWEKMGAGPAALRSRGYAVDCSHYRPAAIPGNARGPRGYVFAAGSAGRNFSALAKAVKGTGLGLKVFSDGKIPALSPELAAFTEFLPLSKNLHALRGAIRGAAVVAVPVTDEHRNEAAGDTMAFLAMACGRPVVMRRTRYTERFIRDGVNGFLYTDLSPRSLRRQLDRALSLSPAASRRLGKAARAAVLRKASLQAFAAGLLKHERLFQAVGRGSARRIGKKVQE